MRCLFGARHVVAFAFALLLTVSLFFVLNARAQTSIAGSSDKMVKTFEYPPARKADQVDDYHGVKVADPYRWLEDLDSKETHSWVEAENKLTFSFLNAIPDRVAIK